MTQASGSFNRLVKGLASELKACGFSRSRSSFYRRKGANWGLINLQKSSKSTVEAIIFTVNVGVVSEELRKFFGRAGAQPTVDDCHWWLRLGVLVEGASDKWWTIRAGTALEPLIGELRGGIVERAIPEIERYIEDASLRDLWLAGRSPGLTDIQRLMNLVVLLHVLGPQGLLELSVRELKRQSEGKPTAGKVTWVLEKLGRVVA